MRAKLKLSEVNRKEWGDELVFEAQYTGSKEDNSFSEATPSAKLTMMVTNPELIGKFNPGEKYFLDFTRAE